MTLTPHLRTVSVMITPLRATSILLLSTLPLVVLSAPASAAATERSITISSTGVATVRPDAVRASFTISSLSSTSSEARQVVASTATLVRASLSTAKIPAADLATTSVTIQPEYAYLADSAPSITGYRASQSWTLTLRNPSVAGSVLDAVSAAGGDLLSLNYTRPVLLDTEKAYASARANAVKKAKAKAASYAKLMGVKLGQVLTISEEPVYEPVEYPLLASKDSTTQESTQIDQGTQDVRVTIRVVWALR